MAWWHAPISPSVCEPGVAVVVMAVSSSDRNGITWQLIAASPLSSLVSMPAERPPAPPQLPSWMRQTGSCSTAGGWGGCWGRGGRARRPGWPRSPGIPASSPPSRSRAYHARSTPPPLPGFKTQNQTHPSCNPPGRRWPLRHVRPAKEAWNADVATLSSGLARQSAEWCSKCDSLLRVVS